MAAANAGAEGDGSASSERERSTLLHDAVQKLSDSDRALVTEELQRVKARVDSLASGESHSSESPTGEPSSSSSKPRWLQRAERVGWLAAASSVMYHGDSTSSLLSLMMHDPRPRSACLACAGVCALGATLIGSFLVYWLPLIRRDYRDWEESAPWAIPTATALGVASFVSWLVAMWPVYGFLTLPVLILLFNGFVVFLDLFPAGGSSSQQSPGEERVQHNVSGFAAGQEQRRDADSAKRKESHEE
jgi:hypothetical protein